MADTVKTSSIDMKKYFWLIFSIWTFFIIAISVWSLLDHKIVAFGYIFLWLLGFMGIVMFTRHLKYSILLRNKAEGKLKKEKEQSELYLNIAEIGLIIVTSDEKITLINKKGYKLLKYDNGELIGRNWFELMVPCNNRDEVKSDFHQLMAGNIKPVEFYENPLLTKDGEERLFSFHNVVIRDTNGQINGVLFSAEDITERRASEKALQAKTHDLGERVKEINCLYTLTRLVEQYDSLEDIINGLAKAVPPSWQFPNITCCRITVLGKEYKSSSFVQTEWKQVAEIHSADQQIGRIEVFYLKPSPKESEGPFLKEEQHLLNALAERLGRVIERKQAIDNAHMHQLEVAHISRVNSIGEMASSLAHEINQPLFVMQAQAERSSKLLESGTENVGIVIDKMQIIIEQAQRAEKIISRIRNYVRKGKPDKQIVTANSLIYDSVNLLETEMKHKNIKFNLDIPTYDMKVNADSIQIEQVIINLINNAIDALSEFPEDNRKIWMEMFETDGYIKIKVKDNGTGMSQDEIQAAFDSFYTTKSYGLGIGLSISRSIIESQGGMIGLEANVDKGMTSYFTLPLYKDI